MNEPTIWTLDLARPSDVVALRELDLATGAPVGKAETDYENSDGPLRRMILVLRSADAIGGFVVARGVGSEWDIENVVVANGRRKHGLGSRLVGEIVKRMSHEDGSIVRLEVRATNCAAIALYRKFGFQQDGMRKRYYSKPTEDALLFSLPLRNSS